MANNKIEITGLRKRWLVSSLSPIFVVALLIAGTFCVVMANYYYNMMLDGLKTRAAHASEYFSSNAGRTAWLPRSGRPGAGGRTPT